MWDLSSLTRDQTHVPYIERQVLNHWTTREVPEKRGFLLLLFIIFLLFFYFLFFYNYSFIYWQTTLGGLVTKLCLDSCEPMDCSPAGSSVHGILQARILEWVAISFSEKRVSMWWDTNGILDLSLAQMKFPQNLLFLQFGMSKATFDVLSWYWERGKRVLSWRTCTCYYWNGKSHHKLKWLGGLIYPLQSFMGLVVISQPSWIWPDGVPTLCCCKFKTVMPPLVESWRQPSSRPYQD